VADLSLNLDVAGVGQDLGRVDEDRAVREIRKCWRRAWGRYKGNTLNLIPKGFNASPAAAAGER
jgi:hypothetical protein